MKEIITKSELKNKPLIEEKNRISNSILIVTGAILVVIASLIFLENETMGFQQRSSVKELIQVCEEETGFKLQIVEDHLVIIC